MDKEIRLTNFSTCGGWAGKASIEVLDRVLGQINKSFSSDKILVDQKTKDDAAVYKITDDKAIIFTTDFFAPVVDDAFLFGQVAADNAISDVYAMGGKPTLALNICCFADNIPEKSIEEIIQGGIEKANEAGVIIAGGHTINDPEPKYGLAVIGEINPKNLMTLKNAKPNQDIVITKPLGNGILISAAKNSKIDLSEHPNWLKFMKELNKIASEIAVDMNNENLLTKEEAINMIDANQITSVLHPQFKESSERELFEKGLNASPGAAVGVIVFDPDTAELEAEKGRKVIW